MCATASSSRPVLQQAAPLSAQYLCRRIPSCSPTHPPTLQDEAKIKELGLGLERAAREAQQAKRDLEEEATATQVIETQWLRLCCWDRCACCCRRRRWQGCSLWRAEGDQAPCCPCPRPPYACLPASAPAGRARRAGQGRRRLPSPGCRARRAAGTVGGRAGGHQQAGCRHPGGRRAGLWEQRWWRVGSGAGFGCSGMVWGWACSAGIAREASHHHPSSPLPPPSSTTYRPQARRWQSAGRAWRC